MSHRNPIGNFALKASFDENDPYPLLTLADLSYRDMQGHAAEVDAWLGLQTVQTEALLTEIDSEQELWIGLPIHAMLTPYIEFRQILKILNLAADETVVDCGAGYGRLGFVLGRHYPEVNFVGFEMVRERVIEAQRCLDNQLCLRSKMVCVNMDSNEFVLPEAEAYFVYDFGHRAAIDRLLEQLRELATRRKVTVVARGRSSRDAIDHGQPWLSQVIEPMHYHHFSVYRSR